VGVRWPSHPFIQAVIQACGFPLAAPSANRSNQLSPTTAEHVQRSLRAVPLIVDGGQSQVGIESTVIDLTAASPRILRPGMISAASIEAVVSSGFHKAAPEEEGKVALRSPGLLPRHYAPRARLIVRQWNNSAELHAQIEQLGYHQSLIHVIAHTHIPSIEQYGGVCVIPHDPEAFARALYSELHRCDELGAGLIIVEAVPTTSEWHAIADRLQRAAS
jgi:L-threonylcarbamoyladenylate synthase